MKEFFQKDAVVLFTGDSITDCGRNRKDALDLGQGYPSRIATIYRALFPQQPVAFYNRGVRGDTTKDLLARYEQDLLNLRPDFVSILIGGNDTWHRFDEVNVYTSPDEFELTYRQLLRNIKRDLPETTILLIEPYEMFCNDLAGKFREDLNPKIARIRKLASDFADYYLPLDGIMHACAATMRFPLELTMDGIHPTDYGHAFIAYSYLKTLEII